MIKPIAAAKSTSTDLQNDFILPALSLALMQPKADGASATNH
jgi:hypothetical protein